MEIPYYRKKSFTNEWIIKDNLTREQNQAYTLPRRLGSRTAGEENI